MTLRFGYWLPVFGGWLRSVEDEGMAATWDYVSRLARRSEELGFDLTLIAELALNDIKGVDAPALDAWSTAAALAAVTSRLEIMTAVRPTFHHPGALAKQAANIAAIAGGRLSLNVVSSWWRDEAAKLGFPFDEHDARYERTIEWLEVLKRLWREPRVTHRGRFYELADAIVEPKPTPTPRLYAGGESEAAREMIAARCDAYVMHGDPPDVIAARVRDLAARRARLAPDAPPLGFGVSGFVICRETRAAAARELERITTLRPEAKGYGNFDQWVGGTQLERKLSLQDYAVSNRGLRAGLVGTPSDIVDRLSAYAEAGVDLVLLQLSPQLEEMERFAAEVIPRLGGGVRALRQGPHGTSASPSSAEAQQ